MPNTSKPASNGTEQFREQAMDILRTALEDGQTQHPLDVQDIFGVYRPTLGDKIPINLYRAVRLLAFRETLGAKISAAILGVSGRVVGKKLGIASREDLLNALADFAVCKASIDEWTDSRIVITATECATCSGLPNIGEPFCYFEGGIIAGSIEEIIGKPVSIVETQCWGLGDQICRWEVTPLDTDGSDAYESFNSLDLLMAVVHDVAPALDSALAIREKNRQLHDAYHRLRESEQLKKDLTDMVVHDLRVPLTSVIGSIQTLAEMLEGKAEKQEVELLDMAISNGQSLLQMINDLLDISKLEEHKLHVKRRPVFIDEVVEDALNQTFILAKRRQIRLSADLADDYPKLNVDRDRIVRVIVNLIANAIRHTPKDGSIEVGVSYDPNTKTVRISIKDTGEGIPKEFHTKIFDKFVQMDGSKSRRQSSSGLGLTFCKLVVEAHDGKIWVESEPGQGSDFIFTLPCQ